MQPNKKFLIRKKWVAVHIQLGIAKHPYIHADRQPTSIAD